MTTEEHLNSLGVSIDSAREFILTNINNPSFILETCSQFNITNQMLADIYGSVSAQDVINFFDNVNLDSRPLDSSTNAANFSQQDLDVDASSIQSTTSTHVSSLVSGDAWPSLAITYSFNTSFPSYYNEELDGNYQSGWQPLSNAAQSSARTVFADIENFTMLDFTEVSSTQGDINFNAVQLSGDTDGFAYYPSTLPIGGEIFLNKEYQSETDYRKGGAALNTLTHELGHALGLKHTFETPNPLDSSYENSDYSIMSYTSVRSLIPKVEYDASKFSIEINYNQDAQKPVFSVFDVAALQAMYGVNANYATGNDTYSISYDQKTHLMIWDAGGTDTVNVADTTGNSVLDLRPGTLSSIDVRTIEQQIADVLTSLSDQNAPDFTDFVTNAYNTNADSLYTGENNLTIAFGVWIENASTGSGNDTVRDNAVNNVINTGAGNDIIQLYDGGYDTVDGGDGLDSIYIDEASSSVTYTQSNGGYSLVGDNFAAEIVGVETLVFTDISVTLA